MALAGVGAGNERVEALDPMCKPIVYQKLQSAVGHRWLAPQTFAAQDLKDFVGPNGPVFFQKNFECSAADRCHL